MAHTIAFSETEPWEEAFFRTQLGDYSLSFSPHPLSPTDLPSLKDIEILSPFIYTPVTEHLLESLPSLRLITTRSTGFDHIDLDACKKRQIVVANVPSYGEHSVAEHTFALLLAVARLLIPAVTRTRRGDFTLNGLRGFELSGKTLGIVGYGAIGKAVGQIARGFGMKVLVYTVPAETDDRVTFADLPTLLSSADILTLHVPYNTHTHHLINKEQIARCKKGSILINTSRGEVVETEALVWALEQQILAGAGLDVLEGECSLKEERQLFSNEFLKSCDLKTQLLNHVLIDRDNVIITPHTAFNTQEALQRILEVTVDNMQAFIQKGTPTHPVG